MTTDALLVVNAGSSSLKFQIFGCHSEQPARLIRGQIDGIGLRPKFKAESSDGRVLIDEVSASAEIPDLPSALSRARSWLQGAASNMRLRAIGHRIVHGGPDFEKPVLINRRVLERLRQYQNLAPLHQPNNLAPVELAMEIDPTIPQVACFDTAYHRSRSAHTDCYAMPWDYYERGIRRYGFHGLSYEFIAEKMGQVCPELAHGRVIAAHLGSGASMCALREGKSIENTMGFTALDGLAMGTRPGQIDAGVVLHLIMQDGMEPRAVNELLYHQSGLKGISGISSDMRDLLKSQDPRAKLAIDHFVYRTKLFSGMLASALGGLDGFVFTAGIGENSPEIRARIVDSLNWLGAKIDCKANVAGSTCISTTDSRVALFVLPTDEEFVIARHTATLLDLYCCRNNGS